MLSPRRAGLRVAQKCLQAFCPQTLFFSLWPLRLIEKNLLEVRKGNLSKLPCFVLHELTFSPKLASLTRLAHLLFSLVEPSSLLTICQISL